MKLASEGVKNSLAQQCKSCPAISHSLDELELVHMSLDFYVNTLGFEKIDDQPMSETESWLEVAPARAQTHIMLGLRSGMGSDKPGFTGYILHTDNIEATCETLKARGVTLTKEPGKEPWGKWAQFTDPDGNEFGIWAPA